MRKQFTLIETAVVLTIVLTLAASSIVVFSSLQRTTLEQCARQVSADLMWLRERAANNRSQTANAFRVVFNPANEWYGMYDNSTILKQATLSANIVSVSHPDASNVEIPIATSDFYFVPPYGTMTSTGNSAFSPRNEVWITLQNGNLTKIVKVFGDTGYITVE